MNLKTAAIIQARTGSTRLPGKVLKKIAGKTILEHVIERVNQAVFIDDIIIATTELEHDRPIIELAEFKGVKSFQGSENDVLERYYHAARENSIDVVVRITSDCPLIDPMLCDKIISFYIQNCDEYVLVTNAGLGKEGRTYPRGLDVEIFPFWVLKKASQLAKKTYQREHVTPWIYENYGKEKIYYYKNKVDYSCFRWTLDTEDDFLLIKKIYEYLYNGNHIFYFKDVLNLFQEKPELAKINKHVEQKSIQESFSKAK
ncbi:MAG: glycosyltransferase family protein [Bacillota bacterium]